MSLIPLDIIYEICRWSLPLYRVATLNRQFHEYMQGRIPELQRVHTVMETTENGFRYTLCGRLHRSSPLGGDDGPASMGIHDKIPQPLCSRYDFDQLNIDPKILIWYRHGKIHRSSGPPLGGEEGPAVINGMASYWFIDDQCHRDGGPAALLTNGDEIWYQHGKIHRDGGPALTSTDGINIWYQNDEIHRDGGPAATCSDGYEEWRQHGQLHREDGPAIIFPDGTVKWCRHGELYSPPDHP